MFKSLVFSALVWTLSAMPAFAGTASFQGLAYSTYAPINPGEPTCCYSLAKTYCKTYNVPMIVLWASDACGYCKSMCASLGSSSAFKKWLAARGYVMVVAVDGGDDWDAEDYGISDTDEDAAFQFAWGGTLTKYPFIGVWWPRDLNGKEVKYRFTGRKGYMITESGSLAQQFMDTVDEYVGTFAGVDPQYVTVTWDYNYTGAKNTTSFLKIGEKFGTLPTAPTRTDWLFDGWYTAAVGGEKITAASLVTGAVTYYAHWSGSCELRVRSLDTTRGSVTGSATVKNDAYVKVTATVKRGYAFGGWFLDAAGNESAAANMRSGSATNLSDEFFVSGDGVVTLYAKFLDKAEELAVLGFGCAAVWRVDSGAAGGDAFDLLPTVVGGKITVKSLPSGIKLVGTSLQVTDAAKLSPGVRDITLTLKGATGAVKSETRTISVPNLTSEKVYGLDTSEAGYTVYAGVKIGEVLSAVTIDIGWSLSFSSLPAGIKWNSKTLSFNPESVPTKAGVYTTAFKLRQGKLSQKATATIRVIALPDWAKGTFNGGGDAGQVQLTVSNAGKLSGKYFEGGRTWKLAATSYREYDPERQAYVAEFTATCGKLSFTDTLTVTAAGASCSRFTAWANPWATAEGKNIARVYAQADPLSLAFTDEDGRDGALTLKFGSSGKVTVKGEVVYGYNARGKALVYKPSGSAVLCDAGDDFLRLYLYLPPKAGKFSGLVRELHVRWRSGVFETVEATEAE